MDARGNAGRDLKNNEPVGRISDSVIRRYSRRVGGLRLRLNPPYGLRAFDDFVFPTSRGENEITATGGSSSVLIDIESVVVSFDVDTTRTAD
jgi:hypothetical protein